MPKNEVANPVDSQCLAAVDCLMVVETVQSILDARRCILLRQAQHGVDVRFFLRCRQLSPASVNEHIPLTGSGDLTIQVSSEGYCRSLKNWSKVQPRLPIMR